MSESKERITRVTLEEARRMKGETDYARLDAMTDEDIARAVAVDPDAAPLDTDWTKARLVLPPSKDNVTLRVDRRDRRSRPLRKDEERVGIAPAKTPRRRRP
jgi:hypothetical protein